MKVKVENLTLWYQAKNLFLNAKKQRILEVVDIGKAQVRDYSTLTISMALNGEGMELLNYLFFQHHLRFRFFRFRYSPLVTRVFYTGTMETLLARSTTVSRTAKHSPEYFLRAE